MYLTGYLKVPDIDGESQRVEHEDEIDIRNVRWKVGQPGTAQVGSGRTQARAEISSFEFDKIYDASSPYIALATMQGKSLKECVFMARRDSGEAHLDYLTITMTNCVFTKYEMLGAIDEQGHELAESIGIICENLKIKYIVQDEEHNAGDEHEIEYDIAAGV